MKKLALLFVATVLVTTTFSSCKKDDEPTARELLTSEIWTGVKYKDYDAGSGTTVEDSMIGYDYAFLSNGDAINYINSVPKFLDEWNLTNGGTKLEITYGPLISISKAPSLPTVFDIISLTETELIIKQTYDNGDTYTEYYRH